LKTRIRAISEVQNFDIYIFFKVFINKIRKTDNQIYEIEIDYHQNITVKFCLFI
jgi:hypothetical protein